VSSIEKRLRDGRTVWRAHYRTPGGKQRNKTFPRKIDAERFLTTVESAKLSGSFSDPALARLTMGEWSARWLAGQGHLKPSTRERYAGILRAHTDPRWSKVKLADVRHADVQAWVSELAERRSASTARKAHRVLSLVLALAVRDNRLARNPAAGVSLPRETQLDRRYLSHAEVRRLAAAAGAHGLLVTFLAYTGLRFGEAASAARRPGRPAQATSRGGRVRDRGERQVGLGHAEGALAAMGERAGLRRRAAQRARAWEGRERAGVRVAARRCAARV
jgi:hypothetical protein